MRFLVCALVLVLGPTFAFGQEINKEQIDKLREVQSSLATVKTLSDKKIISATGADQANKYYLDQATKTIGHEVTANDIPDLVKERESLLQQVAGFFTFTNILWVIAGILLTIAILWLAGIYLLFILMHIPVSVYEICCYFAIASAIYSGNMWFVFPGCLLLPGCLQMTWKLHAPKEEIGILRTNYFNQYTLMYGICTVVWGVTAVQLQSELIGFISVMALMSFLGFTVIVVPGCIMMGYESNKPIPRTIAVSSIVLASYVAAAIFAAHQMQTIAELLGPMKVFATGAVFLGSFVLYISLLIISSKWYAGVDDVRYWIAQSANLILGVAALYIGSVYGISTLLGVGGTFFCFYILEKYYEIPWGNVGWAWSLLGLSGGLYWLAGFAAEHPEYFVFGIR